MDITTSKVQARVAVTILNIRGEVDSSTYQEFSSAMRQAIEGGDEYLLLDLSQVTFLSSAGIRSLNEVSLFLRKRYPQEVQGSRSNHLKLLNPTDRVFDVLKMSGADMFFETYTNLEKAVASF
jgi:anti-anti-sigma factor